MTTSLPSTGSPVEAAPEPKAVTRRVLSTEWQVRIVGGDADVPDHDRLAGGIPAVVPGSVHGDLLAAGIIDDHDVGTAEEDQHWVGEATWAWSTSFDCDIDDHDSWALVLDGIDTMGEVRLNGRVVGTTATMHRRHRFAVGDALVAGRNELEVVIHPIGVEVDRMRDEAGALPAAGTTDYNYVHKMACNFGWDWGPRLVTAALWQPVTLEGWSDARLREVRPHVRVAADGTGIVDVEVDVDARAVTGDAVAVEPGEDEPDLRVLVAVTTAPVAAAGGPHDARTMTATLDRGTVRARVDVPDAQLWWPIGMGEQPLHSLEVTILADGVPIDTVTRRIGFRTVAIDEQPDEQGSRWAITVNGRPVAVRGFNWIPDRPFPGSIPRGRVRRRLDQAVDANANLVRVWGGGIFESSDFYDLCDERGLLVWQDFLFACAAYPETPGFAAEVEAGARQAVVDRLHHASLVLWNGNNECVWGWHDWGWQDVLGDRPWGAGYYDDLLPRLVAELDPTRPYLPASPWSGSIEAAPNDDASGVSHIWDVWNEVDWVHYRDRDPAFVAEMGWCGPATWATTRRSVPHGPLDMSNAQMQFRIRAADGTAKIMRGMAPRFPGVADDDDWLLLAQVNQARALTAGTDHLRSLERCSGVVVWQLNDCWPVISWAAVDGDERRKPLWYALREAFADRRAMVQPDGADLVLVVVNDGLDDWHDRVHVRRVGFDGRALAAITLPIDVPAGSTTRLELPTDLTTPRDPRGEVLVVDTGGQRTTWWFAEDVDLDYPPAAWQAAVVESTDGLTVEVTAHTLLRELSLFPDRLLVDGEPLPPEAVVDSMLVTLLPGETHRFQVRGADLSHASAVVTRPVLRAVNDVPELVAGATDDGGPS